jgi:hypothetical protein
MSWCDAVGVNQQHHRNDDWLDGAMLVSGVVFCSLFSVSSPRISKFEAIAAGCRVSLA